jgi:DNA end-binding protein Ku
MPRALWSGAISFGLVNVPVRMYPAISEKTLHFHLMHEKDASRIRYAKLCAKEEKPVPDDEIVRGYEYRDGEYVFLTDADFAAAEVEGYKLIEISDFVPYDQIDPIAFERTYFLGPVEGAEKVYRLLQRAMADTELAAIATYVFHQQERLGCLRVRGDLIVLERMYFADEVRPDGEIAPKGGRVAKEELAMATSLIERLTGDFDHGKYHDRHRARLERIVNQKRKGKETHVEAPEEPTAPGDLMAALQASLDAAAQRKRRRPTKSPRSRAASRAGPRKRPHAHKRAS